MTDKDSFLGPALGLVLCGALTWTLSARTTATTAKYLNPPPEHIEYFHFGFRDTLADSLWLRWIQDGDVCQTYLKPVAEGAYDPTLANPRHKICDQSWSFKMLDAVTRLAPRYWMPYVAGASTLSVIVEDYQGATVLYDRGLQYFPDDWKLLYRAAYHFQFDVGDKAKAADLLSRAADHGGPEWLKSLAARLSSELGQWQFALANLLEFRKSIEDQASAEALMKLDSRIAELKAKLAQPGP